MGTGDQAYLWPSDKLGIVEVYKYYENPTNMTKKLEGIYCAKCDVQMKIGLLPRYEYEEGYTLPNVHAYQCPKCNKMFFTKDQAHEIEIRTRIIERSEAQIKTGKLVKADTPMVVEEIDNLLMRGSDKDRINKLVGILKGPKSSKKLLQESRKNVSRYD